MPSSPAPSHLPEPKDLTNEDGARWFVEHLKESARRLFDAQDEVAPMALLICRKNPKTRLSFAKPHILPVLLAGVGHGEMGGARQVLRQLAQKGAAVGVGMMFEGWMTTELRTKDYAHKWEGRLEDYPGRVEVLNISWQHRARGIGQATAEIIRGTPGCKPSLGPWDGHEDRILLGDVASTTDLLPPEDS
jgi:hypothetical protein